MKQTLIGLGCVLLGLLLVVFSEPLARTSHAINKYLGPFRPPLELARAMNVLAGVMAIISGILFLFRVLSLSDLTK